MLPAHRSVDPSSAEFQQQLAATGEQFAQANVAAIYCVHGTFAGTDALGLLTELARFTPRLSAMLSLLGKGAFDFLVGETGNFTSRCAATLEEGLSAGAGGSIPVRRFNWSSQNHHVGRADGAIRLIDRLSRFASLLPVDKLGAEPRVQLWGHSHGGNVLALVTNLLGADQATRDAFFEEAAAFYRPWLRRSSDMPVWPRVQKLLGDEQHPLRKIKLDLVTFGTPIRYGWETGSYGKLLHFVHHRPVENQAEYQAPFPLHLNKLLRAVEGDYIQQIGIAGTNLMPIPLAVRTWLADRRLGRLLQGELADSRLVKRLVRRARVPDEGTTLLVDYRDTSWLLHKRLAGHALYTRRCWLPWHLQQIAERFYPDPNGQGDML